MRDGIWLHLPRYSHTALAPLKFASLSVRSGDSRCSSKAVTRELVDAVNAHDIAIAIFDVYAVGPQIVSDGEGSPFRSTTRTQHRSALT